MKITNTTKGDFGFNSEIVIPAGGSIEIDNDLLSKFKANPVVKGWFVEKKLIEVGEVKAPKAKSEPKSEKTDAPKASK